MKYEKNAMWYSFLRPQSVTKGNMINSPDFFLIRLILEIEGKKKKTHVPNPDGWPEAKQFRWLVRGERPYSFESLPCPYRMACPRVVPNSSDVLSGVSCRIVRMVSSCKQSDRTTSKDRSVTKIIILIKGRKKNVISSFSHSGRT